MARVALLGMLVMTWLRENRTAIAVFIFVFGVLCVGVPWAAEVWL